MRFASWTGLFFVPVVALLFSCKNESGDKLTRNDNFAPVAPLTAAEAEAVITVAAEAIDSPDLTVAVVDRVGNIQGVWRRDPTASLDDLNKTVAIARSAAFLSSSQGPLSSRTLEFISTFHFPSTFGEPRDIPGFPTLPPQRVTTGVNDTPQGPLWQIFASNRGAPLAGAGLTVAETGFETLYNPGMRIPPAVKIEKILAMPPDPDNLNPPEPSPGLGYLPGGIPLYKGGRVVGGVGCFGFDPSDPLHATPNACEFAAIRGARENGFFFNAPPEGAIFLVGILLPYVEQTSRPTRLGPGVYDPAGGRLVVDPFTTPTPAEVDPDGYLIGPRADPDAVGDPLGNLTAADVMQIIDAGIRCARRTRAAIRLPLGTTTKMVFAVTDQDGFILAAYRMEDAPIFSLDVSVTKARAVMYFSSTTLKDADAIPGVPKGTAITTRTLGFVSQPAYPPTIDGHAPGPLFGLALQNQDPTQFNLMANADPRPGLQSGLIFFPGSTPLYKNGVLVGGLGVSGDGVEQDDVVTACAAKGFLPPKSIRADQFSVRGVRLPFFKFPQLPGGSD